MNIQVKEYKSAKEFEKDANKMLAQGWRMEAQTSRTKKFRPLSGFATNKGITTVTWMNDLPQTAPKLNMTERLNAHIAERASTATGHVMRGDLAGLSRMGDTKANGELTWSGRMKAKAAGMKGKGAGSSAAQQSEPPLLSPDGLNQWTGTEWLPIETPSDGPDGLT